MPSNLINCSVLSTSPTHRHKVLAQSACEAVPVHVAAVVLELPVRRLGIANSVGRGPLQGSKQILGSKSTATVQRGSIVSKTPFAAATRPLHLSH